MNHDCRCQAGNWAYNPSLPASVTLLQLQWTCLQSQFSTVSNYEIQTQLGVDTNFLTCLSILLLRRYSGYLFKAFFSLPDLQVKYENSLLPSGSKLDSLLIPLNSAKAEQVKGYSGFLHQIRGEKMENMYQSVSEFLIKSAALLI